MLWKIGKAITNSETNKLVCYQLHKGNLDIYLLIVEVAVTRIMFIITSVCKPFTVKFVDVLVLSLCFWSDTNHIVTLVCKSYILKLVIVLEFFVYINEWC